MSENYRKDASMLEKAAATSANAAVSFLLGAASSTFNLYTLPRTLSAILDKKPYFSKTNALALLAGYSAGATAIVYNITQNPKNPASYIPIAANIVGFIYLLPKEKK